MTLKKYFELPGSMSRAEMASQLGCSVKLIGHYVKLIRIPRLPRANNIVRLTGGLVTHEELVPSDKAKESRAHA